MKSLFPKQYVSFFSILPEANASNSSFSDFFPNLDFVTFHTLYAAQEFPKNILSPMNLLPLIPFPHVMLPILPTGQNMGQKSHVNIPPLELPPLCCYSHSS